MDKKLQNGAIIPMLNIDLAVMLVISLVVLWFKPWMGLVCMALSIGIRAFHYYAGMSRVEKMLKEYKELIEDENNELFKGFSESAPLLCCMVDKNASLLWANDKFAQLFETQESFDELAGESLVHKFFNNSEAIETIAIRDTIYEINARAMTRIDGRPCCLLFWQDVTDREEAEQLHRDSQPCIGVIDIDNYDELMVATPQDEQSSVAAALDKIIQNWAASVDGALVKIKNNRYGMVFEHRHIKSLRDERFEILNTIHGLKTKADFPTSLSIGLAVGGGELTDLLDRAVEACELAQARGGDQLVMRHMSGHTEYFGGALPAVEKRSKGRSRIMVHSLSKLIQNAGEVFVMGHAVPDLDSFGAAVGISALAKDLNRPCHIVLDKPSEAIEIAYELALSKGVGFISKHAALDRADENVLLVVVDTHIAEITECPQLVAKASRLAVIDHHRKSPNAVSDADMVYMEVYASSTSELVTEMLQYAKLKAGLSKTAAELLLAGIVLDTKNFTVNTGVRTFDAATWLKGLGAENTVVRSFFKMRLELYQKKANIISNAEILSNGVAVAYTKESDPAMQILVAQAADELLDMIGVEAAFVAGYAEDFTTVSARSLGRLNVQVIMEAMGGGGHQNVAAAQMDTSPEEAIARVVQIMREKEIL